MVYVGCDMTQLGEDNRLSFPSLFVPVVPSVVVTKQGRVPSALPINVFHQYGIEP